MNNLRKSVDEFLFHCRFEKNLSSNTLKAYNLDLKQFLEFVFSEMKKTSIQQVDREVLRNYLQKILDNNKVKTVKRKLATLKTLFNYLEFEDRITINPFRKMRIKIKEPFNLPRILTLNEIKKLFNTIYSLKTTCENYLSYRYKSLVRDIVVVELLFATGVRVFELCNLNKSDVNIEHNFIYIRGKGNKERIIQICHSEITAILMEYTRLFHSTDNKNSYFFLNRLGKRLSEQSVRFMLKKYTRLANIETHVTPHMFRHTFATLLLEEGVDIRYIQRFLGHSSIMTTQIYTHVTKHKEKEILTNKHPRSSLSFTGLKN